MSSSKALNPAPKNPTRKSTARKAGPKKSPTQPASRSTATPQPGRKRASTLNTAALTRQAAKPRPAQPASSPARVPVNAGKAAKPAAAIPKSEKVKKPKLVRDSFTIPKTEYVAIDALKQRASGLGRSPKKSEILRAGIMVLAALSDAALLSALSSVPAIKTGRPKA